MNFNKKIINNWDEAIPLGNGHLGGLLFGDNDHIFLNLDCSSLWDLRTNKKIHSNDFTFDELLKLISKGGDYNQELQNRFGNFYEEEPYPTKIPVGSFVFDIDVNQRESFYLDLKNAIGGVKLKQNIIETFFSAFNFLGYIRLPRCFSFKFNPPEYQGEKKEQSLSLLEYKQGLLETKPNLIIYRQPISSGNYCVLIGFKEEKDYTEIVFDVVVNSNKTVERETINKIKNGLNLGFDLEFKNHQKWWSDYFGKSSISVPDSNILDEYNFGQYLLGSGSREKYPPMPLQGVWTAADGKLPPWKGDYHFDLNVQGTYNFAFRSGRFNEIYPLINYFILNYKSISEWSEKFFNLNDSFFIPGTADLNGNVMGGWVQYTYSLGSSLWMVIILDKWYEFTRDKDYLTKTLFPILKKSFNILQRFLVENNGKYELKISISPEINNNYYSAWVKNSTYDISIIKEFLKRFLARSKEMSENTNEIEKILSNLISESKDKTGYMLAGSLRLEESHRHLSHCMNIFPFQSVDSLKEEDNELISRTVANLEKYGTKEWVGFSFVWMSSLYACLNDGDNALKYLIIFLDGFVSDNGFNLNGDYKKKGYSNFDYRPFTLEANGMFNDAIQEMLVQYHNGVLRLFPAIPKAWQENICSFNGFYLNKNLKINASFNKNNIECEIENNGEGNDICISLFDKIYKKHVDIGYNKFSFKK